MEYFTLGMRNLKVTQNYNGTTSHKKHWYNSHNYADYAIDLGGVDSGRDAYYATVDMFVKSTLGIGNGYTNTVWLETLDKVQTPSGVMKVFIALTHFNDSDSPLLKVGTVIKKGSLICNEGTDGATSNHLHLVCGNASKSCGTKLIKNSNGAWVSNGYCMKPEQIFFIDIDYTKIITNGGIAFKTKPIIQYYNKCSSRYTSLVDGLKSIGVDSSFSNRKTIANKNNIANYAGLPAQNSKILNLLKSGMLIK